MIELEGLEPTTPVGNWNVWFDNTNNHKQVAGRTVFEVSDAGSTERWNVARYDHGNGKIGWMYYNSSLPKGDRWRNFPAAGAADPVPAAQFPIPFQDNTPVRPGPCYGCAFSDAMSKGLLGLAMGGTGLLAGGGVAGGYLFSQSLDVTNETAQQLVVNGRWGLVDWADVGAEVLPMGATEAFGAAFDYNAEEGYRSVFSGDKNPYGAIIEFGFDLGAKQLSKQIGGMQLTSDWQGRAATGAAQFGAETLGGKVAPEEAKKLSGDTD